MSFLKILILLFFNIYHKYSIVLICGNTPDDFKALMLLSTRLICFALDIAMYYCLAVRGQISFFSTNYCSFFSKFLCVQFFVISCVISGVIRDMRMLFATHCIYSSQYFVLATVLFLSHALCVAYEFRLYAQFTRFRIS